MRRFLILAMIFSIGLFAQLPSSLTTRENGKFYAMADNKVAMRVLFFAPGGSGGTLPSSRDTREYQKFVLDSDGDIAVRVVIANDSLHVNMITVDTIYVSDSAWVNLLGVDSLWANWAQILKLTDGTATLEGGDLTGLDSLQVSKVGAYTLYGQLSGNQQNITNVNELTVDSISVARLDADSSFLGIFGESIDGNQINLTDMNKVLSDTTGIGVFYDNVDGNQKNISDLNKLLTDSATVGIVDINGGAIDGTPIGASSASTGAFSTLASNEGVLLDNETAAKSTIASDKTLLYPCDDGSVVKIQATIDDAGTETTVILLDSRDALFQGVQWNQSADTYARLGSLIGYATSASPGNAALPIQSDMKRCLLADNGTVNYYLDADNSYMKQYTTIPYSDSVNVISGDTITVTGATFTTTADTGMWVHNVDSTKYAQILVIHSDTRLVLSSQIFVVGDSLNQYNAILNGDDGQVMVQIPKFYTNHTLSGAVNKWYISKYHLPGLSLHLAFWKDGAEVDYRYMSALEGSMWDATTSAMVAPADVVTNMYAAGDKLCSVAGYYPKTNETRIEFRAMATSRSSSYRQLDYYLHSAVQLLYLIEYADFNSQTMIGMGRSELSGGTWTAGSYIGICGLSLADGNGTNSVSLGTNLGYATDYMTYRGIENLYGNVWKILDGITWDGRWTGSAAAQPVYVTNNSSCFQNETRVNMQHLCNASYIGTTNGYISNIENVMGFIPSAVGASSSTKLCDNYWQYSASDRNYWRLVLVGGDAPYGVVGGVFALYVSSAWTNTAVNFSGRLTY